jgi:hypothetical protein
MKETMAAALTTLFFLASFLLGYGFGVLAVRIG